MAAPIVEVVLEDEPTITEMLRRVSWDPQNKRIVYKSPNTGKVYEIQRLPDVHALDARPLSSRALEDILVLSSDLMSSDNSTLKRRYDSNPNEFMNEVRRLAAFARKYIAGRGSQQAKVKAAGYAPVHVAPGTLVSPAVLAKMQGSN